jgi:hypothetical protein
MDRWPVLIFGVLAISVFGGLLWLAHAKGFVLPPYPPNAGPNWPLPRRHDDWGWFMYQVIALWACLIFAIAMTVILLVT